jgi:hypothetical protein
VHGKLGSIPYRAPARYPVQPSTPQGHDQVNIVLLQTTEFSDRLFTHHRGLNVFWRRQEIHWAPSPAHGLHKMYDEWTNSVGLFIPDSHRTISWVNSIGSCSNDSIAISFSFDSIAASGNSRIQFGAQFTDYAHSAPGLPYLWPSLFLGHDPFRSRITFKCH